MNTRRIVKHLSMDNPPKVYYKIEEIVTSQGHYIEWPESYATLESANKAIKQ